MGDRRGSRAHGRVRRPRLRGRAGTFARLEDECPDGGLDRLVVLAPGIDGDTSAAAGGEPRRTGAGGVFAAAADLHE